MPEAAASSTARGRQAEDLALRHLEAQGLRVSERNRRLGGGELDLVAWDGPMLVFVEVKGRAPGRPGAALEAVDGPKRRRLIQAAQAYLASLDEPPPTCRFDVVTVEYGSGLPLVRHLRDAFRPGD